MGRKRAYDYEAIANAYADGLTVAEIRSIMGASRQVVCRAVELCIPADRRAEIARLRWKRAAMKRSVARQQRKLSDGTYKIEVGDTIAVAQIGRTLCAVDRDNLELLERHPWRASTDGRFYRQVTDNYKTRNIYIYHDVMGVEPTRSQVVDHINGDVTDNRRSNLRICSYSENSLNRACHRTPNSTEGVRELGF